MTKVNSLTIVDEHCVEPISMRLGDIPVGQIFKADIYSRHAGIYFKFVDGVVCLSDLTLWYSQDDTTFHNYVPRSGKLTLV